MEGQSSLDLVKEGGEKAEGLNNNSNKDGERKKRSRS